MEMQAPFKFTLLIPGTQTSNWRETLKSYVVAVPETHLVWVARQRQLIGSVAALLPESAWTVLSAGEGSKGPRLYERAWLQLPEQADGAS